MAVDALVRRVGRVLARAHSLFGDPPVSGASMAQGAAARLAGAGERMRAGTTQMAGLAGALPRGHGVFAASAGSHLDGLGDADGGLAAVLRDAASADRSGRSMSGAVLAAAAADTADLRPLSRTPAGQTALLSALRARVARQQQVVAAYRARDTQLAALVRSLAYRTTLGVGGAGLAPVLTGLGGAAGSGISRNLGLGGISIGAPSRPVRRATGADNSPSVMRVKSVALGELAPDSSPREVAAAVIHEAGRRGYSPRQAIACVSTMLQESGGDPRAVSANGLWQGVFQQDFSYPGRRNPNLAIAEFFDRLDHKGGPASPDIWKSIFWLQQRPGDPSAEVAYARGRQEYLSEIQSQLSRATALYHEIAGR
ncbi:hypothetical protein [uncultured Mycobacterium sp.]|uniref:hypothetical protein n=1 Tax=uncultured Mycobacterium sp. TaxID=171292 RepID=UPI0035CC8607